MGGSIGYSSMDELWRSSGMIDEVRGICRCRVCGEEGPSPSGISHRPDCALKASVDDMCSRVSDPPPSGNPEDLQKEIDALIARLSVHDVRTIDLLLSELRHSKSRQERMDIVRAMEGMCPGAAKGGVLVQYAILGVQDDRQFANLRRYLLFERSIAQEEADEVRELQALLHVKPPIPEVPHAGRHI